MRYVKGVDSGQMEIRVGCVEDEIRAELGFERAVPAPVGRKPYDPRDLIKLYIYGYMNAIRSSRKLKREAGRNIELFNLLNRLQRTTTRLRTFARTIGRR